jgi:hypothetical protein
MLAELFRMVGQSQLSGDTPALLSNLFVFVTMNEYLNTFIFQQMNLCEHASSTTQSRLSTLRAWHFTHNLKWKGSTQLNYVLNSIYNLAPSNSKCPPHPPVSKHMLSQLVSNLDLKLPLDIAIAACAATDFW